MRGERNQIDRMLLVPGTDSTDRFLVSSFLNVDSPVANSGF
jgi:hypothetical protein